MDDLLMHAMLAVSGAHLSFKQPENDEVIQATMSHYNAVIRSIRQEIGQPDLQSDAVKTTRLLLVLIMLCHYEVLSGNTAVNLFQHLRACRQLILWQLPKDKPPFNDLLGFAIELYSYILTSNTFSPYGTIQIRTLPNDSFITSLNSTIGSCSTFGAMLGGAHALFELIPQVSVFHGQRLAEEAQGFDQLSPHLEAQHSFLKASIDNWAFPNQSIDLDTLERKKTAEIIRRALRIYLSTAACGSVVDSPSVICAVQDEVDAVMSISNDISEPQYMSTLLWPLVITASCMVKECQRKETAEMLPKSHYEMTHISVAVELLEKLWKDQDRRAYGPYGLYFIMEKYGIQFSTI
ncbi:uncharacterized protein LTHEOB_2154 [Lasiodiplodia theobromae]|uniref:uncharacterized protein n=1 Tax=Lasiodiplodia theobromae TaxID=45133 RepID=UPI0015C3C500|nr:uncharacterized protein LTHEOB_2154 [Lasiodiplodia theobromae]KAF4536393.1 hypothetical protein LTHEOB_2154 [Lasiodiplodia theobromae]